MRVLALLVFLGCATVPATAPHLLAQLDASRDLDQHVLGKADGATVAIVMASWCEHCRAELAVFDAVRARHPHVRWLAINYKEHEEYDRRGNSIAIRALATELPWLRFVPADGELYRALGSPTLIPTVLVFDRAGTLVERYDRRERKPPDATQLDALLAALP